MLNPEVIVSTRRLEDPPPRVSVAVSTYERASMLPRLITALERQTLPLEQFEVVLTDNGSAQDTADVIEKLAAHTELRLHAIRVAPNRGPAGGRNVAWHAARARVIAFTDDDCAPCPEWLETGLRLLEADEVLVGRTTPDPSQPRGPFSRTVHHQSAKWLPTCNVFYWREDLESVGGFDELFEGVGCEDTDLGLRVRDTLYRGIRYGADAVVLHDVRPSRFLDALRETQRWTSAALLIRRHPRQRIHLHRRIFWHPSHASVLLALFGLLTAAAFPPSVLLMLPWFRLRARGKWRSHGTRREVSRALPGIFLVDLAETVAVLRGALRYRTLVI